MTLTSRGWALVAVSALLVLAGALFGIEELFAVAVATAVVLVGAAIWARRRSWDVRSARQLRPLRVPAGGQAVVELTLRNRSERRSPLLSARDRFDGGRRWAVFAVGPMAPGETARSSYPLPTAERGVYEVGPLRLELIDPFGLVSMSRAGSPAASLTVHPRIVALGGARRSSGSDHRPRAVATTIGPDANEVYAVREYRTGDDLRRVHWASTARLGELMIRQGENPQRGRLTVVVDVRPAPWAGGGFEAALSAAASVAEAALGDGLLVRLATTAGVDTGFATSAAHRGVILDHLAEASLDGLAGNGVRRGHPFGIERSLGPVPGEAVVVVTGDSADGWDLLGGIATGRSAVTAVLVSPTPESGHEQGPQQTTAAATTVGGARLVRLSGGIEQLPAAWAAIWGEGFPEAVR